jgi:hypothetical protein
MTAAGVCALAALGIVIGAFAYAHIAGAFLSPVSAAVSEYGISPEPLRLCYRLATLGLAAAAIALRLGMGSALTAPGSSSVLLGLTIFAAGRAFVGWIPMDSPGSPDTRIGRIHWLLGLASFASAIYASNRLASVLSHQVRWHSLASLSSICSWIMLVGAVPLLVSRFYVGAISWLAIFAAACAINPR